MNDRVLMLLKVFVAAHGLAKLRIVDQLLNKLLDILTECYDPGIPRPSRLLCGPQSMVLRAFRNERNPLRLIARGRGFREDQGNPV